MNFAPNRKFNYIISNNLLQVWGTLVVFICVVGAILLYIKIEHSSINNKQSSFIVNKVDSSYTISQYRYLYNSIREDHVRYKNLSNTLKNNPSNYTLKKQERVLRESINNKIDEYNGRLRSFRTNTDFKNLPMQISILRK